MPINNKYNRRQASFINLIHKKLGNLKVRKNLTGDDWNYVTYLRMVRDHMQKHIFVGRSTDE